MAAPSFYSDPHVQFLSQLLEEIGGGHLQVPRFQRPLVWDWERRRELLRSIRDGIPIGAIMVWRTTGAAIECYTRLGPHRLTPAPRDSTKQYLLDGVQRLSTLYGALRVGNQQPANDGDFDDTLDSEDQYDARDFDVFYDLDIKDFVTKDDDNLDLTHTIMPLTIVFDSVALLRFQRSIDGQGAEAAIASSDEIARAFRDYKVPIIPITTDDLDMATRTFQRINSQGAQMSETHMVHALTWSSQFDLRRQIAEIRQSVLATRGWADLDDDPILKACKASLELDIYRTNAPELSSELRRRPEVLEGVGLSLGKVADFLWSSCGVRTPDLVPYTLQIVLLAEAFRLQPNPDSTLRRMLVAWFWMTTYGELFTGMSGDRAQLAIADMRMTVLAGQPTWTWNRPFVERPLRATFDFRTARAKALAFRLAQRQDELLGDSKGTRILAESGRRSVVQVLPWARERRDVFASPANRFLLHPTEAAPFRDELLDGSLSPEACEAHFISAHSLASLRVRDFHAFIATRMESLRAYEVRFIRPLVELFEPGYVNRVAQGTLL